MTYGLDERLIAFVDGELDGEALLAFQTQLANEPALAERVAAHRWMARQVTAAYGQPPQGSADSALIARLGLGDGRAAAPPNRRAFAGRRGHIGVATLSALAASLALAFIVSPAGLRSPSTLVREPEGRPIASGILAASLTNQLAGEPGRLRIGLSFRTQHGICRTFRSDRGVSGIGCREGDRWLVPMLMAEDSQTAPRSSAGYRLAGADFPPAVMAEVDRQIRGEPLSPAEELRLRQHGWR